MAVPSGGKSIFVLLGRGDGTFSTLTISTSATPTNLAAGDFNGDGRPDLVAAETTELEVFLNSTH